MSVTNLIDINKIKEELVIFLRNSNVITKEVRGVVTAHSTGTFSADTSHTINVSNIKNIRTITVGVSTLAYGTDYTADYDYEEDATIKCKITFSVAQTGAYDIEYDYGTDKIYPDFPRTDLKVSSYPRIAIAITSMRTDEVGLGGKDTINEFLISFYVYADGATSVDDYIKKVREQIIENKKTFYYLEFLTPLTVSPLINEPMRGDKIYTRVLEIKAPFNIETVS